MYNDKKINRTNPYSSDNTSADVRNMYWGEVVSIDDPSDSGRIKVRINALDKQISNENLAEAYPLLPKFIHIYPQVGEAVYVSIDDPKYPQRGRRWMGNIVSQLQNVAYDELYSALSTNNVSVSKEGVSISKVVSAKGVFPDKKDIALIGRENTDVILKNKEVLIRAGKHILGDVFTLNNTNPSQISLNFDIIENTTRSSNIVIADKIALISHDGEPKFKASNIDVDERNRIFEQAHPLGRGDIILECLEILRKAIIEHIHPYDRLSADKSGIITELEKIDFTKILQRNIVIN